MEDIMKTKNWILIAIFAIIIGASLLALTACSIGGDFSKLLTENETVSITLTDSFDSISLDVDTSDINFVRSEDGKCTVVSNHVKNVNVSVKVENGALLIEKSDDRAWYEYVFVVSDRSDVTVYLPDAEYNALTIDASTGDVNVPKDFSFGSLDISLSTGDVEIGASVNGLLKVDLTTGDARISDISAGELQLSATTGDITVENVSVEGDVSLSIGTGDSYLTNVSCASLTSDGTSGNLDMKRVLVAGKLTATRTTGDTTFTDCDAETLEIETSTGDVVGNLLTEKIFSTNTTTGKVNVPDSTSGGICKIKTNTGNITITIGSSEG